MKREEIAPFLGSTFSGFSKDDLPAKVNLKKGKVRDIVELGDKLLIVTSDRISAFDRILTTIPCKGEVLNRLSIYWFNETKDILENHLVEELTPRSMLVRKGSVVPIEVVVRGYLTGSAWRDYEADKAVSGIELPKGMRVNQRFDLPLLTPSTKEEQGEHDRPISTKEIVESGIVEPGLWKRIETAATELFERGSEVLGKRGLILVDTKYEFALLDGRLILVDEIHTPDSSRFWFADTYDELFEAGKDQRKIDKEYLRGWLMERGFMGDGEPPEIPDEVRIEVAWRYIQAYELITGTDFRASSGTAEAEREKLMSLT
ncbi:MAG TPA: phosphoribosylaminoimidazolesuccinocarboxamide synthase [Spirochaetia bacterium]|nr:phosphoribosylaminoimidazolesuccinocarboxamide synthase [Spirochaetia bacterium]